MTVMKTRNLKKSLPQWSPSPGTKASVPSVKSGEATSPARRPSSPPTLVRAVAASRIEPAMASTNWITSVITTPQKPASSA